MSAKSPGETLGKEQTGREPVHPENAMNPSFSGFKPQSVVQFHWLAMLIGFALLIVLIIYASSLFFNSRNHNMIEISGRIEAPETHISAIAATRVKSVLVNEGDRVTKGQLLIELDTGVIKAKVGDLKKFISQASKANQQADLHAAAVEQQVAEARKKSTGFWAKVFTSPKGRAKKGEQLRGEMLSARLLQMQARAAAAKAQAMSSAVSSAKTNFNIKSPISGICETRSIEPGELVAAGQVLLTILDPHSVYMKGYISEGDIGKIKIGQQADVYLDSDSKKAHSAHIASIDHAPSFTPENVYFKDDRVRQVFGVKLDLDSPDGLAKPGISAEARITLKGQNN